MLQQPIKLARTFPVLITAEDVQRHISAMFGAGVLQRFKQANLNLHVTSVYPAANGTYETIAINQYSPKSLYDFFALNMCRSVADAVVITGELLRKESHLECNVLGPFAPALLLWRRQVLAKLSPPTVLLLTRTNPFPILPSHIATAIANTGSGNGSYSLFQHHIFTNPLTTCIVHYPSNSARDHGNNNKLEADTPSLVVRHTSIPLLASSSCSDSSSVCGSSACSSSTSSSGMPSATIYSVEHNKHFDLQSCLLWSRCNLPSFASSFSSSRSSSSPSSSPSFRRPPLPPVIVSVEAGSRTTDPWYSKLLQAQHHQHDSDQGTTSCCVADYQNVEVVGGAANPLSAQKKETTESIKIDDGLVDILFLSVYTGVLHPLARRQGGGGRGGGEDSSMDHAQGTGRSHSSAADSSFRFDQSFLNAYFTLVHVSSVNGGGEGGEVCSDNVVSSTDEIAEDSARVGEWTFLVYERKTV